MTVKELIERLQEVKDKDRIVVLAKDPEGNGFDSLADDGFCEALFFQKDYEIFTPEEDAEDEDPPPGGVPALVLWP